MEINEAFDKFQKCLSLAIEINSKLMQASRELQNQCVLLMDKVDKIENL
jgi:hypothetical protein